MAYDEQDEYEVPCAMSEISVHNGNIHAHQAPFFGWHGIKQKEEEEKVNLSNGIHV